MDEVITVLHGAGLYQIEVVWRCKAKLGKCGWRESLLVLYVLNIFSKCQLLYTLAYNKKSTRDGERTLTTSS